MSGGVLAEPAALRALGRGEQHPEAFAALASGQAQRVLRSLELIRRRCSTGRAAERDVAILIGEWIHLAGAGDSDALRMIADPFVEVWATGVLRDNQPVSDAQAIARLAGPQVGSRTELTIKVESANSLVLSRCGGVLTWAGSPSAVVCCRPDELTVTTDAGSATFRRSQPPKLVGPMIWKPTAQTQPASGRYNWTVALDGRDPASNAVGPGSIDELQGDAQREWIDVIDASWRLLEDRHGAYIQGIVDFAKVLVPQTSDDPLRHISGSSADGFGAIALSLTSDVPTFAVALIHETQHLKLNALLDVVTLHRADSVARYYAGWRDDPRPFQALLHGVYAFSAVTEFWRVERQAQADPGLRRRYEFEYALWAAQTTASLRELIEAGVATPAGRHFLAGLEDVAARWNQPVNAQIATAVGDVMAEHRLNWQLAASGSVATAGTGLRRAWRLALTGVDIDSSAGPLSAVDAALVSDDARTALTLARELTDSDPLPANILRLSRAYAHADMATEASAVVADYLQTIGANVQSLKAGCS